MSARSRANRGRLKDVGRAPPPAAFAVGVDLDFSASHSLARFTGERQIPEVQVKSGGRGRPPYTIFCTTRATVIS